MARTAMEDYIDANGRNGNKRVVSEIGLSALLAPTLRDGRRHKREGS